MTSAAIPRVKVPTDPVGWPRLADERRPARARALRRVIDHYNLAKGRWKNPPAGLDDELRVSLAECLGKR